MLIPFSPPLRLDCTLDDRPAWNDPVRSLYPYHADLWPMQVPEHVLLRQRSLRLVRKRRRLFYRKLARAFFRRLGFRSRSPKAQTFHSPAACDSRGAGRRCAAEAVS